MMAQGPRKERTRSSRPQPSWTRPPKDTSKRRWQLTNRLKWTGLLVCRTISAWNKLLKQSEEDRAVRLKANQQLVRELKESEEDRTARLKANRNLEQLLKESEEDRAARLEINQKLEQLLKESEADRAARLEIIHKLESLIKGSEESEVRARTNLEALKENKIVRFLIRLGLVSDGKNLGQPKGDTGEEES